MIRRFGFVPLAIALGAHLSACSSVPRGCADRPQVHDGSIEINGTKGATRLQDLECVQTVTGSVTISDPRVSSLEQLSSLVHVHGDVTVTNVALQSLRGLEQLTEVGGKLQLTDLKELESLDGLEGLRKLDGALTLSDLPKLTSLEALGALDAIGGSLSLHGLDSVVSLEGLGAVGHIGGYLEIDDNQALTDVDAFKSLSTIDGAYRVSNNPALLSASFRTQQPAVGGDIGIRLNASLKTLAGFGVPVERADPCEEQDIFSGIAVSRNDSLEVLELPNVRGGNVRIQNNERLLTISSPDEFGSACLFMVSSLPSLTSLSLSGWNVDSLQIDRTGLTTLDGLQKVAVDCWLGISENAALVDVGALSPGGDVARWFDVSENASLASCQVQAMLDALPNTTRRCPVPGGPGGRIISIEGNDDSAVCE